MPAARLTKLLELGNQCLDRSEVSTERPCLTNNEGPQIQGTQLLEEQFWIRSSPFDEVFKKEFYELQVVFPHQGAPNRIDKKEHGPILIRQDKRNDRRIH